MVGSRPCTERTGFSFFRGGRIPTLIDESLPQIMPGFYRRPCAGVNHRDKRYPKSVRRLELLSGRPKDDGLPLPVIMR
jgi:hypothetical protein